MDKHIGFLEGILKGAAVLPLASLSLTRILSPLLNSLAENGPGSGSQLTVPVSAQGTAYFVNHPDRRHNGKLCL